MAQLMVNPIASSLSNSPSSEGRKGQPTVISTSFIHEQIDIRLNYIMLELSKKLANIVKPMVHNEIQVAQQ